MFVCLWFYILATSNISNPRPPVANPRSSDSPISQNGRRALFSFGHPDWCICNIMDVIYVMYVMYVMYVIHVIYVIYVIYVIHAMYAMYAMHA